MTHFCKLCMHCVNCCEFSVFFSGRKQNKPVQQITLRNCSKKVEIFWWQFSEQNLISFSAKVVELQLFDKRIGKTTNLWYRASTWCWLSSEKCSLAWFLLGGSSVGFFILVFLAAIFDVLERKKRYKKEFWKSLTYFQQTNR